jgi:hypothetical protein
MTESDLVQAILLTFGARPDCRIWRANTGAMRDASGRVIRFGVPGQADISGLLAPTGQRLEIECKSRTGRQSPEQVAWQAMIERHGGIYILARSLDDVRAVLDRPH